MSRTKDQIAEEIRHELNSNGWNIYDHIKTPVSMACIESVAHQLEMIEFYIDKIVKHFFVTDDEGDGLDKRLSERGLIPRFAGAAAIGNIILGKNSTYVIGSIVQAGTIFKTLDGSVSFSVTQDTNIVAGTTYVSVPVSCTVVGAAGNLLPDTELTYSGIAINEVEFIRVDAVGLSGGLVMESDDVVRQRLLEDMKKQVTSNNKNHFIKWAKEVSGVGDAICIPLWNGDNTVKVVIIDNNKQPASLELIATVQDYIDPGSKGLGDGEAQLGTFVTVAAAVGVDINVAATLVLKPGCSVNQIKSLFIQAFTEYLKSIAFKSDDTVRYSRIGTLIIDTEGVLDYSNLTVNGSTANIAINDGAVAIPGTVTFI